MNDIIKDFKKVLKKYNAELLVEEHNYRPYLGGDWNMVISFKDYTKEDINLGSYLDQDDD